MGSYFRHVALACIVAGALPQAAAVSEALHVLVEHGPDHGRSIPVESMMPVLHGHAHSADAPEHDHPLTAPATGGEASHGRRPPQLAVPVSFGGVPPPSSPAE